MSFASAAKNEYLRTSVGTASSEQLHLMLLDGAIRFTTQACEALDKKDFEGSFNALDRAQKIVVELTSGLNREANPALVDQFRALYQFIYAQLVRGGLSRERQPLEDAQRILRSQRDTWQIIVDKIAREVPRSGATARPTTGLPGKTSDASASSFVAEG
ncbi:MAG: flagellar export chaperone FliS [Phycisphaerae bacterium]|nr:flagellar export chaperone FliS [Phycisphaerae bacterium]